RIRSGDFGEELRREFAKRHDYQKAANGESLGSARAVLEALAKYEGPRHELHNRFARHDGAIFVDMADRQARALCVTNRGFDIVPRPPLLFRRYAHQAPLSEPVRGTGNVHAIVEPFAMDDDARLLVIAWLIA